MVIRTADICMNTGRRLKVLWSDPARADLLALRNSFAKTLQDVAKDHAAASADCAIMTEYVEQQLVRIDEALATIDAIEAEFRTP